MAEGLVKHYQSKKWKAFSAGTKPSGYVHPLAIKAMDEIGIDISKFQSKSVDKYRKKKFDLVMTVCDSAAEDCPVWLGKSNVVHISFPDPAEASGSEKKKMKVFRSVRDDMQRRVFYYLEKKRVLIQGQSVD
jgi:arsenate reductase